MFYRGSGGFSGELTFLKEGGVEIFSEDAKHIERCYLSYTMISHTAKNARYFNLILRKLLVFVTVAS